MSRNDPYRQRPGETDEEHIKRLNELDAANRQQEAERERLWNSNPFALRMAIDDADDINDLKAILRNIVDALEDAA